MSANDAPAVNSTGELDERDVRALTEYLTVLPEAPGIYEVVSQSGRAYIVDAWEGTCTCPDFEYHRPDGGCKHLRRVAFATGERSIPPAVPDDAVDDQLGRHVSDESVPRSTALDDGDGGSLGPFPAVTKYREPVEQGGALYWRCEGCGRETIYGRESLVHTRSCPRRGAD